MPIFIIERSYAEELKEDLEAVEGVNRINDEEGIRWLYSFLSQDLRKTYCIYEAPNADAIRSAAVRAGLSADVIIELTGRLENTGVVSSIA